MKEGYGMFFNNIMKDVEVSDAQFRIYCAISGLCAENGECRAGNKYLSELFKKTPETITRNIKELEDMGYISIRYTGNGTDKKKRFISLTNGRKFDRPIDENVNVNNNILSEDNIINNINIINRDKGIKINSLLSIFKSEVEKRNKMFVPNSKMDRINMSNFSKNKDVLRILELKQFDLSTFITKIFELSDKIDFWKEHPIDNTSTFYRNWAKILNQSSLTLKPQRSKEELERIKSDLLNNF